MGATAAIAVGLTKPLLVARTAIVAACPPPKITTSFAVVIFNINEQDL